MKRDRLEIIAEVLNIAKSGARKTRIMYSCNLSHAMTKDLLVWLSKVDLIRTGSGFQTTEKGYRFLNIYRNLELLLNTKN